jgi:peptidoglycan DL-endopeptidase CwlO
MPKSHPPQEAVIATMYGSKRNASPPPHALRAAAVPALLAFAVGAAILTLALLATPAAAVPAPATSTTLVLGADAAAQVGELQGQAAAVQAEIQSLDTDLERLTESFNELTVRLNTINSELNDLRRQEQSAIDSYNQRQDAVNKRLTATYKAGKESLLEVLLATENFGDFVKRLMLITKVALRDQGMAESYISSASDLSSVQKLVEAKKAESLQVRRQLETKQADVEGKLAERQQVLAGLDASTKDVIERERQRQETERLAREAELRTKLAGWQMYDGPLPTTDDAVLNQVVETAAAYLGIPYTWGGEHPSTGMDCSGFTQYVYKQHGIDLPHYSGYQALTGVEVSPADIKPGDLVAFGDPVHHVGIYIGEGQFIDAPNFGEVIQIEVLAERNDLTTIRRFPLQARTQPPLLD